MNDDAKGTEQPIDRYHRGPKISKEKRLNRATVQCRIICLLLCPSLVRVSTVRNTRPTESIGNNDHSPKSPAAGSIIVPPVCGSLDLLFRSTMTPSFMAMWDILHRRSLAHQYGEH
jgi:hypothetical protein